MTTSTFTVLQATITNWTVEEAEKVIESSCSTGILVTEERAEELLATGRRWLSAWRSVDYTHVPALSC